VRVSQQQDSTQGSVSVNRVGLALFGVYVLLYGGFMALVLAGPDLLATRVFGGVNLAIACGLGLIVAAVVLSVVYILARASRDRPGRS
jgi:uncharacterized membrane protein (DUF485 family)